VPRKYLILVVLSGGVLFLDQWTKFWVVDNLTTYLDNRRDPGSKLRAMYSSAPPSAWADSLHFQQKRFITVKPDYLRIRYAENSGAAWGLFRNLPESVRTPFFHVVSIVAIILILFYFRRLSVSDRSDRWMLWGLPLVLGGAVGNYVDRLARGFVIDFIEAHWHDRATWPSFNVADMAICVGVGLLLFDSFLRREKRPAKASPAAARP
jgi:signal peptidase II